MLLFNDIWLRMGWCNQCVRPFNGGSNVSRSHKEWDDNVCFRELVCGNWVGQRETHGKYHGVNCLYVVH